MYARIVEEEKMPEQDNAIVMTRLECGCVADAIAKRGSPLPLVITFCPLHESAPALLEALETMIDFGGSHDEMLELDKRARTVIATARGEG